MFCFELYLCAIKINPAVSGYKRAPKIEEIINALSKFLLMADRTPLRVNARNWVEKYFNANKNYQEFVSRIELLSNE